MRKRLTGRRINGSALEQIMRDVLNGMQDVTRRAGAGCETGKLEILGVDRDTSVYDRPANIIPFPGKRKNHRAGPS